MIAIEFMFAPFVACLLLIGINIYFGIHVIKREIIFIDIAMAQIAALGGTVASIVLHLEHDHAHDEHNLMGYLFAIFFTTCAAAVFTIVLPVSIVASNRRGSFINFATRRARGSSDSCSLSSIDRLSENKALSTLEKNADNASSPTTIKILIHIYMSN